LQNTLDSAISPRKCGNLLPKISAQISLENPDELAGAKAGIGEWGGYSFRIYVTRTRMQTNFIVEYLNPEARSRINVPGGEDLIPESPLMVQGFSISKRQQKEGAEVIGQQATETCHPEETFEALGYPSNRTDLQKVVLAKVDERLLALEFGVYSDRRFEAYEQLFFIKAITDGSLLGAVGQSYLLVKEAGKSFATSWAETNAGENFGGYSQPIDMQSKEDIYSYSCVFNFNKY
jgi:hypothetical protein